MKRKHCDIIIKVQKSGFVKFYANGKWQKKVTAINFHADSYWNGKSYKSIACEFEKIKTEKNGSIVVKNNSIAREHHVANVRERK